MIGLNRTRHTGRYPRDKFLLARVHERRSCFFVSGKIVHTPDDARYVIFLARRNKRTKRISSYETDSPRRARIGVSKSLMACRKAVAIVWYRSESGISKRE